MKKVFATLLLAGAACSPRPRRPAPRTYRAAPRLASLYDWNGKSSREARPILARLERMSARRLIDGQYFRDPLSGDGGTVQLVTGAEGAATVTEIPVSRRAGCLLLAL